MKSYTVDDFSTPKKAAKVLDVIKPDWYKMIDVGKLKIMDYYDCILGQVFGDFGKGVSFMQLKTGVNFENTDIFYGTFFGYMSDLQIIEDKWIKQIKKRKGKDNA